MISASLGLIGGLTGGVAGLTSNVAEVVAGNQGQQIGKALGESEAAKQGLTGKEKDELVNSYQQTFATLGGALGGLVASSVVDQAA